MENQKKIRRHFKLSGNKNMTVKHVQTATAGLEAFVILNVYVREIESLIPVI